MSLDTYRDPGALYTARGPEVNPNRPIFTGDVFNNVEIPGVQNEGMAMIVAHPWSFRGAAAQLADRVSVIGVRSTAKQGANAWTRGLYDRTPLPGLAGQDLCAGHFNDIGQAQVAGLSLGARVACLSEFGINMLQQRLTFHLTRAEIPTSLFSEAFSHTFVEAELLEVWTDTLTAAGWSPDDATTAFDAFIRSGNPTLQAELLDPQMRAHVRSECRREARRAATHERAR